MRILVDHGCYDLLNQGDVAMLQVAVSRLSSLWPEAFIQVITDAPDRLAIYCPYAHPVQPNTRLSWYKVGRSFGRPQRFRAKWVSERLSNLERKIWRRWPWLARRLTQLKVKRRGLKVDLEEVNTFSEAFWGADLIIASGGGYINDAFRRHAVKLLDMLKIATEFGIPTAMFSQGLGPIQHPELQAKVKATLPLVNLLTTREDRYGISLLSSLGALPFQVMTTGDDAIELAYTQRASHPGGGIGLNLRAAAYSGVGNDLVEIIRTAIGVAAQKHGAQLIPLPISFYHEESDVTTIQQLLKGYDDTSDGGQSLDHPLKIIEQVGCCRVVVTGSYHAAVFALAQGIPVVGLVKSLYYSDKFSGLANQFGLGCEIISLDDPQLYDKLTLGLENAWKSAEWVRPHLLKSAAEQIEAGQAAYRQLYDLVERRHD